MLRKLLQIENGVVPPQERKDMLGGLLRAEAERMHFASLPLMARIEIFEAKQQAFEEKKAQARQLLEQSLRHSLATLDMALESTRTHLLFMLGTLFTQESSQCHNTQKADGDHTVLPLAKRTALDCWLWKDFHINYRNENAGIREAFDQRYGLVEYTRPENRSN